MPRQNIFIDLILDCLDLDIPLIPYENPYVWAKRKAKKDFERKQYQETIWRLRHAGILNIVEKNNQKFLEVTKNGQLKILLQKAAVLKTSQWDGKWRVLIFDIPERYHPLRDHFRALLKRNNFVKLQGSVFVSPYPLNREAILYLQEAGLMNFIRILRVDEMDNDSDLRVKFGLTPVAKTHGREKSK